MEQRDPVAPAERSVRSEMAVRRGGGARGVAVFAALAVLVTGTVIVWATSGSGAEDGGLLVRNGDASISLLGRADGLVPDPGHYELVPPE